MLRNRTLRRIFVVLATVPPFFAIFFSRDGILSPDGRTLIAGKMRRIFLSLFPAFARHLQKKYGLVGGCQGCGASCNLLFQCPHWDERSRLCSVYEDRPDICRLFPITPADIRDREIVLRGKPCGFTFTGSPHPVPVYVYPKRLLPPNDSEN
jgi:hypothetical protein